MQSNLILAAAQAQAVYGAMCALKSVGAKLDTEFPVGSAGSGMIARMYEAHSGAVVICAGRFDLVEYYPDAAAFAAAYGLPVAAPDLVAALRIAYSDIQRLPGHTIDMLGRIEAAIEQATA